MDFGRWWVLAMNMLTRFAMCGCWLAVTAGQAWSAPTARPVLDLLAEGTIDARFVAHGAYELRVQLKNEATEPIEAQFEPGLVGDTFGQNEVYAQILGQNAGRSGSQGVALLEQPSVKLAPGATASLTIRTCCMNYGLPEPHERQLVFLKRVEDYTPIVAAHALLKELASHGAGTGVAQAAIWRVANDMSWDVVARAGAATGKFTGDDLALARDAVAAANSSPPPPASAERDPKTIEKRQMSLSIHPDPEGSPASCALAWGLARALRERMPAIETHHRNYESPPDDPSRPALAWVTFLRASGAPTREGRWPIQLGLRQSQWDPRAGQWRVVGVETFHLLAPSDSPAKRWLADEFLAHVAGGAVHVAWTRGAKKKRLTIVNDLPIAIDRVTIADAQGAGKNAVALEDLKLEPGASRDATLSDEQARTLAKVRKPTAFSFTLAPAP